MPMVVTDTSGNNPAERASLRDSRCLSAAKVVVPPLFFSQKGGGAKRLSGPAIRPPPMAFHDERTRLAHSTFGRLTYDRQMSRKREPIDELIDALVWIRTQTRKGRL